MVNKDRAIFDYCSDNIIITEDGVNDGIVQGNIGLILCYSYFYQVYEKEAYGEACYSLLNSLLYKEFKDASLGYGLAGIAWGVDLLYQNDLLEDFQIWQDKIDEVLCDRCELLIVNQNTDYFVGANGVLNYLVTRKKADKVHEIASSFLQMLCDCLETLPFIRFNTPSNGEKTGLNLGVPHGLSGIVAILLRFEERKIGNIQEITQTIFEVLFKYQRKGKEYDFPCSDYLEAQSHLAWCYGDLPICYFLFKYMFLFSDNLYRERASKLLNRLLQRTDCRPQDITLCHGTIVVAYLFYKIWRLTNDRRCLERSKFWQKNAENTFYMMFEEYRETKKYTTFFENPSLLYGLPGFLIARMTMNGQIGEEWDSCLLL